MPYLLSLLPGRHEQGTPPRTVCSIPARQADASHPYRLSPASMLHPPAALVTALHLEVRASSTFSVRPAAATSPFLRHASCALLSRVMLLLLPLK